MKYKYSKLAKTLFTGITWEQLIARQESYNNCTGKTTSEVLMLIATAMSSPEETICIREHSGLNQRRLYCRGGFISQTEHYLDKLSLEYFKLSRKDCTLTYNPYGYITKAWVECE